jgi:hypothetical protein
MEQCQSKRDQAQNHLKIQVIIHHLILQVIKKQNDEVQNSSKGN